MDKNKVISELKNQGFSLIKNVFSSKEMAIIKNRLASYSKQKHPGTVMEHDNQTARGLHGLHLFDDFFHELSSDPRFRDLAFDFLKEPCYVHQFKVNVKRNTNGQAWPWHQDFIYWQQDDGITEHKLVNIGLLIDDVTMENGPLKMLPGSHLKGELTDLTHETNSWLDSLSKDLTYQVSPETVNVLVEEHGLEYMTGKSGDVLMFDPMIVHSSSDNLSSSNRTFLIITFNAVSNAPPTGYHNIRPDFLCNRNSEPLMASKSAEYLKEKEVDQV